jgi:hypothetical protein
MEESEKEYRTRLPARRAGSPGRSYGSTDTKIVSNLAHTLETPMETIQRAGIADLSALPAVDPNEVRGPAVAGRSPLVHPRTSARFTSGSFRAISRP